MAELVGDSQDGIAVQAHSVNSHGVFGRSETGNGIVGHTNGDPGGGNAGVFGEHLANGTGVTGKSAGGFGVAGISQSSTAVFADSEGGFGVQAHSVNNHGLVSRSETANGVVGHSNGNPAGGNAGVFGEHLANGTGVTGKSAGGFGVAGLSQSSNGVLAQSETGVGLFAKGGRLAGFFQGDVEITGDIRLLNADCAEQFAIAGTSAVEPGTVMVLSEGEGGLRESQHPYDRRVAGVISGAGSFKPGIVLDAGASETLRVPVALLGKVFCKVDAQYGGIHVGDLLTTSATPGHAMVAADAARAGGAILGKALRPLDHGCGLIPILVTLS